MKAGLLLGLCLLGLLQNAQHARAQSPEGAVSQWLSLGDSVQSGYLMQPLRGPALDSTGFGEDWIDLLKASRRFGDSWLAALQARVADADRAMLQQDSSFRLQFYKDWLLCEQEVLDWAVDSTWCAYRSSLYAEVFARLSSTDRDKPKYCRFELSLEREADKTRRWRIRRMDCCE